MNYQMHRRKAFQRKDPYWDNVVLYLPMTGANGSTTFTDVSKYGHTVTRNGDAVISTAQAPPLAGVGSSGYFDGNGDYLEIANSTPLNLSSTPWTVECLIRPVNGYGIFRTIFAKRQTGSTTTSYEGYLNLTDGYVGFYNGTVYLGSTALTSSAWNYVAWVYTGTNIQIWIGTSGNTAKILDATATISEINQSLVIGGTRGYTEWFDGNLSHLRITKGVARDVSVVPTAPFPVG